MQEKILVDEIFFITLSINLLQSEGEDIYWPIYYHDKHLMNFWDNQ